MNNLNVFKSPKLSLRYPSNWSAIIRTFFRSFKWAYQRVTRGFADYDVWDFDGFLLNILANGLEHLADTTISYPGDEEFPTYESWIKYLREMAMCFRKADEGNDYFPHPKQDLWWNELNQKNSNLDIDDNIVTDMLKEAHENENKREEQLVIGLDKLKHVFFHLWD